MRKFVCKFLKTVVIIYIHVVVQSRLAKQQPIYIRRDTDIVACILDFYPDKIRFEIEAEKRLQLENNERMNKMAAAEKERQLAEQRKVHLET